MPLTPRKLKTIIEASDPAPVWSIMVGHEDHSGVAEMSREFDVVHVVESGPEAYERACARLGGFGEVACHLGDIGETLDELLCEQDGAGLVYTDLTSCDGSCLDVIRHCQKTRVVAIDNVPDASVSGDQSAILDALTGRVEGHVTIEGTLVIWLNSVSL